MTDETTELDLEVGHGAVGLVVLAAVVQTLDAEFQPALLFRFMEYDGHWLPDILLSGLLGAEIDGLPALIAEAVAKARLIAREYEEKGPPEGPAPEGSS